MTDERGDSFDGVMPAEAIALPSTIGETLTASGSPVAPDAPGMVFGVLPAE